MPTFRISQASEVMGVSADTMRRWADAGRIPTIMGPDGRRVIAGKDLAKLAVDQAGRGNGNERGQSARNRLSGIVTGVRKDGVTAQVEIQAGAYRLVALITREAADELKLEPGMLADAVVKATNLGIDVSRFGA